jgi:hypothetical protein
MKKLILFLTFSFTILNFVQAQIPPNAFNYSAVARGPQGQPIASQNIGIRFSILKTSVNGPSQYVETHQTTTDPFGLFNLKIGGGSVQSGNFASIDWGADNYFLKVELDAQGNINYFHMGTTQFVSVPYALYSGNAVYAQNGIDSVSISGDTLYLSSGQTFVSSNSVSISQHYIGEEFGGGVIFHLWKDSQGVEHGLIVDKTDLSDLSTAQVWSNIDQTLIGPSAQSSWDGLSNSNTIVGQAGHTSSAAALCLNSTNGGQSDWYLPSVQELNMLWNNYYTVARSLTQISSATQLHLMTPYWSSTESDVNAGAWGFNFDDGSANDFGKNATYSVRAVRAF